MKILLKWFIPVFLMLCVLLPSPGVLAVSAEELGLGLVDVGVLDPSVARDIKYATADNFTGQVLYPSSRCLLREDVAERLLLAQRKLKGQGMGLKVFDCYRPVAVQKKMWAVFPDENYVANPASGSLKNDLVKSHMVSAAVRTQIKYAKVVLSGTTHFLCYPAVAIPLQLQQS